MMNEKNGWIDIHCHIIPGVDDGAKDPGMTREMLKKAYEEGIRTIIATPHFNRRYGERSAAILQNQFDILKKLAAEISESLDIYLGNEIYYSQDAGELLNNGKIHTMAGTNYVLVEFSPRRDFNYIKNALYQLQTEGYIPILAHVERYECLYKEIERIEQIIEMGVYLQTNSDTVIGANGFWMKQYIKRLLKEECIHFIGTDAHRLDKRPPEMKKCAEFIRKKYGDDYADRVLFANAEKMLKNKYV